MNNRPEQRRVPDRIPQELRSIPRWCTWHLGRHHTGRPTKVPDQSVADLRACRTWEQVADLPRDKAQGIGFVVKGRLDMHGGVFLALDLDACRDPANGVLSGWSEDIVDRIDSYTELSPSGTGLRIAVAALNLPPNITRTKVQVHRDSPPGVEKRAEIQVFGAGSAGYTTWTGQQLEGTPDEIRAVDINWLFGELKMLGEERHNGLVLPHGDGTEITFAAIREHVESSERGRALLAGRWEQFFLDRSASEAYFELVCHVLRATRGNGKAAVLFLLLENAWSNGWIDSADPSKYGRHGWVEKEVMRAAAKTDAAVDLREVFPSLGPEPLATNGHRPVTDAGLWARLSPTLFKVAPVPRDYLLTRPWTMDQPEAGFAPMGIPAFLSSEGGVGKTNLLLQLGIAVVTGKPWLGFEVDPKHRGQRVLLVLAEEKPIEVDRRIRSIGSMLNLTEDEQNLVLDRLTVLALAGRPCPLAVLGPDGRPQLTKSFDHLLAGLQASPDDWALVALDPLARLFPLAESNNELATFAIQAVEKLTEAPGCPLVLLAHHSSKMARRTGSVDHRGVTGLTDAARWALTLLQKADGTVEFVQGKSNYGARLDKPVLLHRVADGLLRVATEQERGQMEDQSTEEGLTEVVADGRRIVKALRHYGPTANLGLLAKRAGIGKARCGIAAAYAKEKGLILHDGETAREKCYRLAPAGSEMNIEEDFETGEMLL